jgi:hypothetical protein
MVLRNGEFSDAVAIHPSGETAEPVEPRALLERIQKAMVGEE